MQTTDKKLHLTDDYPYEKITTPLLLWYRQNKRDLPWRKDKNPYKVWVSEIMLQQTRVEGAKDYYKRFLEKFPTVYDLAAADEQSLLKAWEGLGYYSRVRNMQKAARQVCDEYNARFPDTPESLRKLAGIGDYTAGAIASIAYGRRTPAVDGNVFRVLSRLTCNPTDISLPAYKKYLEDKLRAIYPQEGEDSADFTQALMELGALICKPTSPDCNSCPLQGICRAEKEGAQEDYPILPKKRDKRVEKLYVFILLTKDGVSLRKRGSGVLKGMYEFPTVARDKREDEALQGLGIDDYEVVKREKAVHIFTHIRWEMDCVLVRVKESPFEQFTLQDVEERISLPTAFIKAKKMLEEWYGV